MNWIFIDNGLGLYSVAEEEEWHLLRSVAVNVSYILVYYLLLIIVYKYIKINHH